MSYLRICALTVLAVAVLFVGLSYFLVAGRAVSALVPNSLVVTSLDLGAVSLDWDDVPNATEYQLRYWDTEWHALPHGDIRVTMQGSSGVVHGLPEGTEMAFAVRTRAASGRWSDWSDSLHDVILPARTQAQLARPTNLTVTLREPGMVTLDWEGLAPPNAYQVSYWSTTKDGGEWVILPDAGIEVSMDSSDGSGAVIRQLPDAAEQTHSFAVRAFTEGGISEWSETLRAPAYLKAPENLRGWYQGPGLVALDWPDIPGAQTYEILYWHETPTTSQWSILPVEEVQVSLNGSEALVDLQADISDVIQSFAVRAVSSVSQSAWSEVAEVMPVLEAPSGLLGRLLDDGTITLEWREATAKAYDVRLLQDTESGPQWVILPTSSVTVNLDGTRVNLDKLPDFNTFSFQVRSVGERSESEWSEVLTLSSPGNSLPPASPATALVVSTPPPPPATPLPDVGTGSPGTVSPTPTVEPTPTPRRRSSSRGGSSTAVQPTPTPRPRAWLSPNPQIALAKGDSKKFTVNMEGIPAGAINVMVILQDDNKRTIKIKLNGHEHSNWEGGGGHAYYVNRENGKYVVELKGENAGTTTVGLEVYRDADPNTAWGGTYTVTVNE